MTIHKAKGLEFGTVIVPGLDWLPAVATLTCFSSTKWFLLALTRGEASLRRAGVPRAHQTHRRRNRPDLPLPARPQRGRRRRRVFAAPICRSHARRAAPAPHGVPAATGTASSNAPPRTPFSLAPGPLPSLTSPPKRPRLTRKNPSVRKPSPRSSASRAAGASLRFRNLCAGPRLRRPATSRRSNFRGLEKLRAT